MTATIKPRASVRRTNHPHIVKSDDIFDGMPRIDGTRTSVLQVTWWIETGLTPEQIVAEYPPVTLAQVHDALAYAVGHPEEMAAHAQRYTLRSMLRRADLAYVDGRLIPRSSVDAIDAFPGAEVYTWETLPEGKD